MPKEDATIYAVVTTVPGFVTSAEIISQLRAKYAGVQYDVSTATGMAKAVFARKELRDVRVALDKRKPDVKREALGFCAKVEADYKMLRTAVSEYEDIPDAIIKAEETRKEEEKAEKLRIAADAQKVLDDKILEIGKLPLRTIGMDSVKIQAFLDSMVGRTIGGEFTGETRERAELAKSEAIDEIRKILVGSIANDEALAALKAEQEAQAEVDRVAAETEMAHRKAAQEESDRLAAIEKKRVETMLAEVAEKTRINDIEMAERKKLADDEAEELRLNRAAFAAEQAAAQKVTDDNARIAREKEAAIEAESQRVADEQAEKQREVDRLAAVEAEKKAVAAERERKAADKALKLANAKCKDSAEAFRKILAICQDGTIDSAHAIERVAIIAEANVNG